MRLWRGAALAWLVGASVGCGRLNAYSVDDTGDTGDSVEVDDSDTPDTSPPDSSPPDSSPPDSSPPDTSPPDTSPPDSGGGGVCDDTCSWAGDGYCDDGGPGADFSLCALGSDCTDCGPRTGGGSVCANTCLFSYDGECDDGGPGASWALLAGRPATRRPEAKMTMFTA